MQKHQRVKKTQFNGISGTCIDLITSQNSVRGSKLEMFNAPVICLGIEITLDVSSLRPRKKSSSVKIFKEVTK